MKKRRNTAAVRPVQPRLFDNKKLAALLIPLALDQLLNSFMGTVDTLVVSIWALLPSPQFPLLTPLTFWLFRPFSPLLQEERLSALIILAAKRKTMPEKLHGSLFLSLLLCH